jgi:hypothetical protein
MSSASVKAAADNFIKDSITTGTMKGYKREWIKWLNFARARGARLVPPSALDLEAYLMSEGGCSMQVRRRY